MSTGGGATLEDWKKIWKDGLVPDEVLALVHRHALVTSVGKRCGRPRITQAGIHALMIDSARAGQSVVRLKSGDPLVFGRAGEEITALRGAGVRFEVVPAQGPDQSAFPLTFRDLPKVDLTEVARERLWVFDYEGGLWTINGQIFDPNRVDAGIEVGQELGAVGNGFHDLG